MDFDLSEDQRALQDLCTRLAGTFEDSYWQGIDEDCRFPREFWDRMAESGLLGLAVPAEYGGSGLGLVDMCLAAEARLGEFILNSLDVTEDMIENFEPWSLCCQ